VPSTTILVSLGILVVSFLAGIAVYALISKDTQANKRKQIEHVVGLVINFIIYIWIGKIIVNLTKFIQDPLSILAYPSNSYAIYIATILLAINLLYRYKRKGDSISSIAYTFLPIFLSASFLYEFLQIVVEQNSYNIIYLILIAVLMLFYIVMYGRVSVEPLSLLIGLALLIGQIICTSLVNATIFSFRLSPIYFIVLLVLLVSIVLYRRKRKV